MLTPTGLQPRIQQQLLLEAREETVAMNYKENWGWMLQSPTGMFNNLINERQPDYGGRGGVGGLFCCAIHVIGHFSVQVIKWSR